MESRAGTKRTRFVLISDTHSTYPKLPAADVIIHAGDLTNQGSFSELKTTLDWLDKASAEVKIVIAGNHDITLDQVFYAECGQQFHNQHPQNAEDCLALMTSYPGITYLHHTSTLVRLCSPNGPHTTFRVFGSPYVPARGIWAFGYDHEEETAADLWRDIPLNTDIVVTHTPAYNHKDASPKWGAAGCEGLRKALWRVKPKLAVCGHVHEGRGAEIVTWRTGLPFTQFCEEATVQWSDPGARSKKLSLIDLTTRGGKPLMNDCTDRRAVLDNDVSFSGEGWQDGKAVQQSQHDAATLSSHTGGSTSAAPRLENAMQIADKAPNRANDQVESPDPITSRLDRAALSTVNGCQGRKQTCIVNAAIMAKSWGRGPKESNKPIVLDMDMPVWEESLREPLKEDHSRTTTSEPVRPGRTRHSSLMTSETLSIYTSD